MLLYSQRKLGYTSLTGVDYSEGAVTLAKSVAHTEGYDDITYEVCSKALIDVPKFGRFSQYLNEHTKPKKKKKKKKARRNSAYQGRSELYFAKVYL